MFPALEPTGCYLGTIDPSKILVSPKSSDRWTFPDISNTSFYYPRESHSHPCFPRPLMNNRSAGRSGLGTYEVTAFALHSGEHETLCSPSWQLLHLLLPIQLTVILYLPKFFFFLSSFTFNFLSSSSKFIIITYLVLSTKTLVFYILSHCCALVGVFFVCLFVLRDRKWQSN